MAVQRQKTATADAFGDWTGPQSNEWIPKGGLQHEEVRLDVNILRGFVAQDIRSEGSDGAKMFGADLLSYLDLGTDNERLATSMGTMIKAVRAEPDDSVQYTLDILTRADQQADALKLSAGGRLFVKRLIQAANERCQEAGIVLPETKDLK